MRVFIVIVAMQKRPSTLWQRDRASERAAAEERTYKSGSIRLIFCKREVASERARALLCGAINKNKTKQVCIYVYFFTIEGLKHECGTSFFAC